MQASLVRQVLASRTVAASRSASAVQLQPLSAAAAAMFNKVCTAVCSMAGAVGQAALCLY